MNEPPVEEHPMSMSIDSIDSIDVLILSLFIMSLFPVTIYSIASYTDVSTTKCEDAPYTVYDAHDTTHSIREYTA